MGPPTLCEFDFETLDGVMGVARFELKGRGLPDSFDFGVQRDRGNMPVKHFHDEYDCE
jgi:hypothetical protein